MLHEMPPFKARLNIYADFLATRYSRTTPRVNHQTGQVVSIQIHGRQIMSQYDSCIRYHVNGYHLRQSMQDKHSWSDSTWEDVDFGLFGQHFRRRRPHHQVTHMKRVHDQLPIGIRRYQQSRIKDANLKIVPLL